LDGTTTTPLTEDIRGDLKLLGEELEELGRRLQETPHLVSSREMRMTAEDLGEEADKVDTLWCLLTNRPDATELDRFQERHNAEVKRQKKAESVV
jgi:hypothetical protein